MVQRRLNSGGAGAPDGQRSGALSAVEQTVADTDQTLSDADQAGSDSDQTSADRDQIAADRDQSAADRGLERGSDPTEYTFTRDIRRRSARERQRTAATRLSIAAERDKAAHERDLAALARDRSADARDLAMAQHDAAQEAQEAQPGDTGEDPIARAAAARERAADERAQSAAYRSLAAADRQAAAEDRAQAARDRLQALADREALAQQLAIAETDPLTGARARRAGLADLDREVDRSHRTGGSLVVAYVDVVGLKAVNDSQGHAAGDELLRCAVAAIRSHLRTYDLIIRVGGDEFVCAMPGMSVSEARRRLAAVADELRASRVGGSIRAGFARLTADATAEQLIASADAQLIGNARR